MNQRTMQPTPTEYNGVRFRSKSEAVFARCLEIAGWEWKYEPEELNEIHSWDFYINCSKLKAKRFLCIDNFYIEYKPTKPTDTYIENLALKVNEWQYLELFEKTGKLNALVAYGSPWSPVQKECTYCVEPIRVHGAHRGPSYHEWRGDKSGAGIYASWVLGITNQIAKQAKSYRFDLRH